MIQVETPEPDGTPARGSVRDLARKGRNVPAGKQGARR